MKLGPAHFTYCSQFFRFLLFYRHLVAMARLDDIPSEIIEKIAGFLPAEPGKSESRLPLHLRRLANVNKYLSAVLQPLVWEKVELEVAPQPIDDGKVQSDTTKVC